MSDNIDIIHYDSVDSTNRIAMKKDNIDHLQTIVADTQTGGRGRMGRNFYSYNGGLYMSVILLPDRINIPLCLITPAAAVCVKKSLDMFGAQNTRIKWVNDILIEGRKVCGILTEAVTENNKLERVVVGIGINLVTAESAFPDDIKNTAGYVSITADKMRLAEQIIKNLGEYLSKESIDIVNEYSANIARVGDTVTVSDYANNCKITGKLIGVDENCYLKIQLPDGTLRTLLSGEIIE